MSITFTVADPVSVNRAYGNRAQRGKDGAKGQFMTREGRMFKSRCVVAATIARHAGKWPSNPWLVAKARVSYQLFDYRGDTDGPRKLVKDCLERVLYTNDRLVEDGPAPLPIRDGNGRRMVVTVELLEQRTAEEAAAARKAQEKRDVAALKRKIARQQKKASAA